MMMNEDVRVNICQQEIVKLDLQIKALIQVNMLLDDANMICSTKKTVNALIIALSCKRLLVNVMQHRSMLGT